MKFSYMIVIPHEGEVLTLEKTASIANIVTKIAEFRGSVLPQPATALLVQWAKKAVAGQYIQVDKYLIVRTLEKDTV